MPAVFFHFVLIISSCTVCLASVARVINKLTYFIESHVVYCAYETKLVPVFLFVELL